MHWALPERTSHLHKVCFLPQDTVTCQGMACVQTAFGWYGRIAIGPGLLHDCLSAMVSGLACVRCALPSVIHWNAQVWHMVMEPLTTSAPAPCPAHPQSPLYTCVHAGPAWLWSLPAACCPSSTAQAPISTTPEEVSQCVWIGEAPWCCLYVQTMLEVSLGMHDLAICHAAAVAAAAAACVCMCARVHMRVPTML